MMHFLLVIQIWADEYQNLAKPGYDINSGTVNIDFTRELEYGMPYILRFWMNCETHAEAIPWRVILSIPIFGGAAWLRRRRAWYHYPSVFFVYLACAISVDNKGGKTHTPGSNVHDRYQGHLDEALHPPHSFSFLSGNIFARKNQTGKHPAGRHWNTAYDMWNKDQNLMGRWVLGKYLRTYLSNELLGRTLTW